MPTATLDKEATRSKLLERFPFFRQLAAPLLERLLAEAQLLQVPAGGTIFDDARFR